jgi:hypothetical protein
VGTKGISLKGIQRLQVRHSTSSVVIMNITLTRIIMVVAPRSFVDGMRFFFFLSLFLMSLVDNLMLFGFLLEAVIIVLMFLSNIKGWFTYLFL